MWREKNKSIYVCMYNSKWLNSIVYAHSFIFGKLVKRSNKFDDKNGKKNNNKTERNAITTHVHSEHKNEWEWIQIDIKYQTHDDTLKCNKSQMNADYLCDWNWPNNNENSS